MEKQNELRHRQELKNQMKQESKKFLVVKPRNEIRNLNNYINYETEKHLFENKLPVTRSNRKFQETAKLDDVSKDK